MARPTCWECGKQLMYYKGQPVFAIYTDPLGHEHKMHKDCFKYGNYAYKKPTVTTVAETHDVSGYYTKCGA